jgi:predicted MFS family arabinose efflux permease
MTALILQTVLLLLAAHCAGLLLGAVARHVLQGDRSVVQGETTAAGATAESPAMTLVIAALFPFAFAYLLSYLLRAVNAIVAPNLVREIGLSAAELGLLTSAYLASFALFQLPLGVLLDRYGPRRVQTMLIALGAVGSVLFALARDVTGLTLARALIGIAFSGGLMAGFKAVVMWVPEPRRALANACIMSLGGIGLLFATTPFELAVQAWGWRAVFMGLGGVTLLSALLIFLMVPERKGSMAVEPLGAQIGQVGRIYSDRVFLAIAPLMSATAGTHIAIQTLWAGPWLKDVAGLDRLGVANTLFLMAAAFVVSILTTGVIADLLVRCGVSLLTVMLIFLLIFLVSQVGLVLNPSDPIVMTVLWCTFAMTGHVAVLGYPWLTRYFGASVAGRSNTAVNLVMFAWAFLAQYGIGAVIGMFPAAGAGRFSPESYQAAFGLFLAIQLLTLVWYLANWRRIRAHDA